MDILERNIIDDLTASRSVILASARDNNEGAFTVVCSASKLSYLVQADLHCEATVNGNTCLIYRGSNNENDKTLEADQGFYSKKVRVTEFGFEKPVLKNDPEELKTVEKVIADNIKVNNYFQCLWSELNLNIIMEIVLMLFASKNTQILEVLVKIVFIPKIMTFIV